MPNLLGDQRTVYHLLRQAARTWGAAPALQQPLGGGKYRSYSWVDYREIAEEVAAGLRTLGVQRGDLAALASETRAEFYFADVGIMTNGSIAAALYTSLSVADQVRSLQACEPSAVFVQDPKAFASLHDAGGNSLKAHWILLEGEAEGAITFEQLRDMGRKALLAGPALLASFERDVIPSDYAIMYLTSGATGEPKMGLSTHSAVISNVDMGPPVIPSIGQGDIGLAFLPSAHITQRLGMELLPLRMGIQVVFSQSLTSMPHELKSVRPTFFIAPPRVWERIYTNITTEIRKRPAVIRQLFYLALGTGSEAIRAKAAGREPNPWVKTWLGIFDRIVFTKIRERLGGRLRLAVSGAAPLGQGLAEFYACIGMPLHEGYGLTEGGIAILNPYDDVVPGSIGKPLNGVEVKLAEDGELLLNSPGCFSGYFKNPAATATVLHDGWLSTGDTARIDSRGYVYITGRKKELIISSSGKKIFPSHIEALFKLEPLVNQVLLIGDRRPFMTALFTVNQQAAEAVPDLNAEMKRVVKSVNRRLAPFEQIRKFKILDRDFSIETGELTPTLKLRRGKVLENFKHEIHELYAGKEEF